MERRARTAALGRSRAAIAALAIVALTTLASCSDDGSTSADRAGRTDTANDDLNTSVDDGTSDSPAAETGSDAPADCSPARPVEAGRRTLTFDGVEREYSLSVPDGYDGSTAAPLIFGFHGFGSSGEQFEVETALGERGAEAGFLVVVGTALGDPHEWNMFGAPDRADDYGYIDALVQDLEASACVDADRIFAAGHSNGSAFTGFLKCREPFRFAAVAMVSATIPSTCPAGVRPSVLAIAGDADPGVPYDGGSVAGGGQGIPPAVETMAAYRESYGCDAEPEESEPHAGVRRESATGCDGRALVVFDTVVGGTHPWPGTPPAKADEANSEAGQAYDATGSILDFFASAPDRAPTESTSSS